MSDHTKPIGTNQGVLSVKRCVCGGVHICLGGISINLARETAFHLQEQLSQVCDEIREKEESPILKSPFPRYFA